MGLELKIMGTKLGKKMQNTFWEIFGNAGHSYVSYLLVFSMHSLKIFFRKPLQLQYDYTQVFSNVLRIFYIPPSILYKMIDASQVFLEFG